MKRKKDEAEAPHKYAIVDGRQEMVSPSASASALAIGIPAPVPVAWLAAIAAAHVWRCASATASLLSFSAAGRPAPMSPIL